MYKAGCSTILIFNAVIGICILTPVVGLKYFENEDGEDEMVWTENFLSALQYAEEARIKR